MVPMFPQVVCYLLRRGLDSELLLHHPHENGPIPLWQNDSFQERVEGELEELNAVSVFPHGRDKPVDTVLLLLVFEGQVLVLAEARKSVETVL